MLWRSGTRKKPVYAEFPAMEAYYEVEVIIPDDLFENCALHSRYFSDELDAQFF